VEEPEIADDRLVTAGSAICFEKWGVKYIAKDHSLSLTLLY